MWPDPTETQELLKRAAEGSDAATNELFERHRAAIRRMVDLRMDRMLQQRVDASDIVQDALLDAHRRLPEYLRSRKMPFHLWLRQMAKDRLIDTHRRHREADRRSLDREESLGGPSFDDQSAIDLLAQISDRELTPCAAATRRELQRRFQSAIDELDEIDREVILMRHFELLSNQETASALGLTAPAAGMRYLRAVRRLRASFDTTHRAGGEAAAESPKSGSAPAPAGDGLAPDHRGENV